MEIFVIATDITLLLAILLVALLIAHKVRRVHLKLFEITRQLGINGITFSLFTQMQALHGLYLDLGFERSLPMTRGWAASPDFLIQLEQHALSSKPRIVVECSSGVSTVILARCMQLNGGGHVYCLEHDETYAHTTRANLLRHGLSEHATVLYAPLRLRSIAGQDWLWYDEDKLPQNLNVDMLVIDGPPEGTGQFARYPAGPVLFGSIVPGGIVFLDDAARDDEKAIVERWKQEWPTAIMEYRPCEKGCAVLRMPDNLS